jgi:hydroxyethylthiazole kinase-like uncharacterized protein yjeF
MRKKSVTVKQIQEIDRLAMEQYGVPSLTLMENAGSAVTKEIFKQLRKIKDPRVCIFCGLGNNAGDGFVVARQLISADVKTAVYLIGAEGQLKHDAAVNYRALKELKWPVAVIEKLDEAVLKDICQADIVVDAIFGVGINRKIEDPFYSVIEAINQNAKKILAVDIPSGLDGTTGRVYGACIKADTTVTFSFLKKGFQRARGSQQAGNVIVADIGIPNLLKKRIS